MQVHSYSRRYEIAPFLFAIPVHVGDANGARRSRVLSKMLYGYSDFAVFLKIVF